MNVRGVLLVACVMVAGCAEPSVEPQAVATPDWTPWLTCPEHDGDAWHCEEDAQTASAIVRDEPPSSWMCRTFMDSRMEGEAPFPSWYAYVGRPEPSESTDPTLPQAGIQWDSEAPGNVIGVVKVLSDDDETYWHWEGGARGFAQFPVGISQSELWLTGLLLPAGATPERYANSPQFSVNETAVVSNLTLDGHHFDWRLGQPDASHPEAHARWDILYDAQSPQGRIFNQSATNAGWHLADARDAQGSAHWGAGRSEPFDITLGPEDDVAVSVHPYMAFDVHLNDIHDPLASAMTHYMCGCEQTSDAVEYLVNCTTGALPVRQEMTTGQGVRVSVQAPSDTMRWLQS